MSKVRWSVWGSDFFSGANDLLGGWNRGDGGGMTCIVCQGNIAGGWKPQSAMNRVFLVGFGSRLGWCLDGVFQLNSGHLVEVDACMMYPWGP